MVDHVLRIATRASALARWQAERVRAALESRGTPAELVPISTEGDRDKSTPIAALAGRGVFVKEVQAALLDGRADLAVHSAKDLTSGSADGLVLAAFMERGDVRDALVGSSLDGLRSGATVATGSVRRRAQLAHLRPDLAFVDLRGNMDTRIAAAERDDIDAVVVAAVALERLGVEDRIDEHLSVDAMLPQVGQGAIAVECRDDGEAATWCEVLDDEQTRRCVEAERAFLATLGGGCDLPVAAYATLDGDVVHLRALIASHDGRTVLTAEGTGADTRLGERVARELLDDQGGSNLVDTW